MCDPGLHTEILKISLMSRCKAITDKSYRPSWSETLPRYLFYRYVELFHLYAFTERCQSHHRKGEAGVNSSKCFSTLCVSPTGQRELKASLPFHNMTGNKLQPAQSINYHSPSLSSRRLPFSPNKNKTS